MPFSRDGHYQESLSRLKSLPQSLPVDETASAQRAALGRCADAVAAHSPTPGKIFTGPGISGTSLVCVRGQTRSIVSAHRQPRRRCRSMLESPRTAQQPLADARHRAGAGRSCDRAIAKWEPLRCCCRNGLPRLRSECANASPVRLHSLDRCGSRMTSMRFHPSF